MQSFQKSTRIKNSRFQNNLSMRGLNIWIGDRDLYVCVQDQRTWPHDHALSMQR